MGKDLKGKELGRGLSQRPDGRYMGRAQVEGKPIVLYGWKVKELKRELARAVDDLKRSNLLPEEDGTGITLSEWFEEWYGITLAPENLFEGWTDWVSVDQLREQIETLTGIETDDGVRYQTDERFNPLPPEINRWINLLDTSTVPLPNYVSKIGE
mgnify:CR=1 FL=1